MRCKTSDHVALLGNEQQEKGSREAALRSVSVFHPCLVREVEALDVLLERSRAASSTWWRLVVDRLGRSLKNLVEVLGELHAKGVDLYLRLQGLDTSTPSGRAMFR